MGQVIHRYSKKTGMPPGSLVHIGETKIEETRITVLNFDEEASRERTVASVEDAFPLKDSRTVSWIHVAGLSRTEVIQKFGSHFALHPLVMEDILNTGQRTKAEDHGDYLFIVLKMLCLGSPDGQTIHEQVSLIVGKRFLLSFQESAYDLFSPIRERLKTPTGRAHAVRTDYLAYMIIDAIVDNYYVVLEKIGEDIETSEEALVTNPTPGVLQTIHGMKREMILLRRSVWPLREVVSSLERGGSPLIDGSTLIYLRDVYDHTIQVVDIIEMFRDIISGMLDTYLSSMSNKMNEIMKVLTIFASIFIPLTFIVGVYGMNFEYLPELKWHWGYFGLWAIMITLGLSMVAYFRKNRWI